MKSILSNLVYDIRAVKKYGVLKHLKYLFNYRLVIVSLHFHLDHTPQWEPLPQYQLLEVDHNDPLIMEQWCRIVNDAFNFIQPYTPHSAIDYLNKHIYKKITNLYLLYDGREAVGTFFIGTFRINEQVGCGGRFAVMRNRQGKRLGEYLVLAAMQKLRERGIKHYEEVFVYARSYSINMFMRCGGKPEWRTQYRQFKGTRKSFITNLWVKWKIRQMYGKIQESFDSKYLQLSKRNNK